MVIAIGSRYESQLVRETQEILEGGLKNLALAVYQIVHTHHDNGYPTNSLTLKERFLAGLVYSEFFAESSDDTELCASEDRRQALCKRLGIDSFELFKATENIFRPGSYKEGN